jgi:predicted dehydrogenase
MAGLIPSQSETGHDKGALSSSSRRTFLGALSAASYNRLSGANDRVQLGFIGCGIIARQHLTDFKALPDVDIAATCDAYMPRAEQCAADFNPRAKAYQDFRRVIENKDIQAVCISTPSHWHALMTIMACAAGKDVYVEKPMTVCVKEGRWMIEAARRYKRVVQVGTQQRSGAHYQKAATELLRGYLGKIVSIRSGSVRNCSPGFGRPPDSAPPPGMDWDLFVGPAPMRPYNVNRGLYNFRWFWDYDGGQQTNMGTHEMDIVLWALQAKGPTSVCSFGGRYALQDNCEVPDTQDSLFEFPGGCTAAFTYREASVGGQSVPVLWFFGSKGGMEISRAGYRVYPDNKMPKNGHIPAADKQPAIPPDGPRQLLSGEKREPWIDPLEMGPSSTVYGGTDIHARNFVDCIKSRQLPNADVEGGHYATAACHLANISLRLGGRKLRWDAEKEDFVGDREASAMLVRPYRSPWDNELRSLMLGA